MSFRRFYSKSDPRRTNPRCVVIVDPDLPSLTDPTHDRSILDIYSSAVRANRMNHKYTNDDFVDTTMIPLDAVSQLEFRKNCASNPFVKAFNSLDSASRRKFGDVHTYANHVMHLHRINAERNPKDLPKSQPKSESKSESSS